VNFIGVIYRVLSPKLEICFPVPQGLGWSVRAKPVKDVGMGRVQINVGASGKAHAAR
jgi:hypothetical protein